MNSGLQLANALALTSAAGLLLFLAGSAKKRLEWRPRRLHVRLRLHRR